MLLTRLVLSLIADSWQSQLHIRERDTRRPKGLIDNLEANKKVGKLRVDEYKTPRCKNQLFHEIFRYKDYKLDQKLNIPRYSSKKREKKNR